MIFANNTITQLQLTQWLFNLMYYTHSKMKKNNNLKYYTHSKMKYKIII